MNPKPTYAEPEQILMALEQRQAEQMPLAFDRLEQRMEQRTTKLTTAKEKYKIEVQERIRTEAALRESEGKYRLLVKNLPGFVYKGFMDWSVEFYDNKIELLTGYSADAFYLNQIKWSDLIITEDFAAAKNAFVRGLKTDNSYVREYRIRNRSGQIVWIRDRGQILCDENGNILYVGGVLYDITERKEAEENIRKSERKYRELYKGLRDASAAVDMTGRFTEFNPAFQKMLGYSEAEIYQLNYEDITPEKWHIHEAQIIKKQVLTRGYSDLYEKEYRKKDGTIFPVELITYLITDDENRPAGMWATIRDITHQKQVQKERNLLATAVEHAAESVIISDRSGTIRYVNPAFEKLSDYTREEIVGQNFRILKSDRHNEAFYREMWEVISHGKIWTGYITNTMKDRSLRLFKTTISPIRDTSGEIVSFVSVNRDVTQERVLQAQLEQAQKMEAVGTLAGGVAHDFNNLLQAIQGYTELLMLENSLENRVYQALKEIFGAAKRGAELTQQLLTFSRKVESKRRPLDLNQEVDKARRLMIRTIPKMIEIRLHLERDLQTISADPNQIEQILMNLGVNARDAMPDGGELIITTKNLTLDEEFCKTNLISKPGRYVRLSFSDTGCGMDPGILEHIFEPFYTTKAVGRGTGLGLAMVYGIVKSHDGYITCNSAPNKGTRFDIYFPAIKKEQAPFVDERNALNSAKGGAETILLVDDEESVRYLGEQILIKFGYSVYTASDGEKALDLFRQKFGKIDLVILDLIMPGMGGKKCLEELFKIDPKVRVVAASGYVTDVAKQQVLSAGAMAFINKPYDISELLEKVRETLGKN